jgi:hypothetical protein
MGPAVPTEQIQKVFIVRPNVTYMLAARDDTMAIRVLKKRPMIKAFELTLYLDTNKAEEFVRQEFKKWNYEVLRVRPLDDDTERCKVFLIKGDDPDLLVTKMQQHPEFVVEEE